MVNFYPASFKGSEKIKTVSDSLPTQLSGYFYYYLGKQRLQNNEGKHTGNRVFTEQRQDVHPDEQNQAI